MPGPLSAEDKVAIMELIARYAQCIDGGDRDGYTANFVPDATIEWVNGSVHGHDQIRAWVGDMIDTGQVGSDPAKVRHFVGIPYITGDSERANVRTYVILFTLGEGEVRVPFVGSYTDTCVKAGGQWLFEKRIIGADLGGFRPNAGRPAAN